MPSGLPDLSLYPPTIPATDGRALAVRSCRRSPCVKCGGGAEAGYADGERFWPTCIWCARRAAKIPCPRCGDVTPFTLGWSASPDGGGRRCYNHESGGRCYEAGEGP